jgi:hypothetical protein
MRFFIQIPVSSLRGVDGWRGEEMFMHVNAKYMTHDGDLMNNLFS